MQLIRNQICYQDDNIFSSKDCQGIKERLGLYRQRNHPAKAADRYHTDYALILLWKQYAVAAVFHITYLCVFI